jgi:hypothetical protein
MSEVSCSAARVGFEQDCCDVSNDHEVIPPLQNGGEIVRA